MAATAEISPEQLIEAERLLRANFQFDIAENLHQRIRQIYARIEQAEESNEDQDR